MGSFIDGRQEAAAREYCRVLDLDADEVLSGADPKHPTLCRRMPRWQWVLRDVLVHQALTAAVRVLEAPDAST